MRRHRARPEPPSAVLTQVSCARPKTLAALRERIEPYLEAGLDHICIGLPLVYQEDLVARIAEEVAPLLASPGFRYFAG